MNKIRKISVALSLTLGLGLNVQSAMAGDGAVYMQRVSNLALLGALEEMDDAVLDKEAFVDACQQYNFELELTEVAAICLQTVGATGVNNVSVCQRFVREVALIQSEIATAVNSGMMRYAAVDGIRPDKTKISAITPDGVYMATAMEFPDYMDFSQMSEYDARQLRDYKVIFEVADDKFVCAPHIDSHVCRESIDSDVYFELMFGEIKIKAASGWGGALDFLPVRYAGIPKFRGLKYAADSLFDEAYSYANVYENPTELAQRRAIKHCLNGVRGATVNVAATHTTHCNGSECRVTVSYAGMKYDCKFGPNWEILPDSNPETFHEIGAVEIVGSVRSLENPAEEREAEDSGNMPTYGITAVEIVGSSSSGRSSNEGRIKGPKEPLPTTDSGKLKELLP